MKKVGLLIKESIANSIKNDIKESSAIFVLGYSGLSGPCLSTLRQSLKGNNATLFVVKNSVARRALKDSGLQPLVNTIEGPCGLVFVRDEPIGTCGVLYNFSKNNKQLNLVGGYLKDKLLERKDIEFMALLPSKEVLRLKVLVALNSSISKLVITLNQILAKLVYCLEQIKRKNEPKR